MSVLCVERAIASGRAREQESVLVLTCDSELAHPARKKGPVLVTTCTHRQAPTTKYRTKTARLPCQKRAISMGLRATRLKMELSAFNSEAEAADE